MSNVVKLFPASDPDTVLTEAHGNYSKVVVAGFNQEGEMDIRADTGMDIEEAYFLLALAQKALIDYVDES